MNIQTIKTITVIQPWAILIINNMKHIETRSWQTQVRGRIAIHAGKNAAYIKGILPEPPMGCIIGSVDLIDCIPLEEVRTKYPNLYTDQEIALGDWSPGRYGFILSAPIQYSRPIPMRGKQGWWDWKPSEGL